MIATHLHHDYAGLEGSFGRAFEKLVNFFLNLVTDLLLSTFMIYSAGDILDFDEVGLHCRSAQMTSSSRTVGTSLTLDSMQRRLGFVAIERPKASRPRLRAAFN
jgi:hypothetical protein